MPAFLRTRRWFGGKARQIVAIRILDAVPVPRGEHRACLCLVRVEYRAGPAETYQLNLAFASGEDGTRILAEHAQAVVASLEVAGRSGVLYGATWHGAFGSALLEAIGANLDLPGITGTLEARHTGAFGRVAGAGADLPSPVRSSGEQSNTSLRFGDRLILKLFRKVEPGVNPDVEIGTFLTERTSFTQIPPALGSLLYRTADGEPMTVGLLQGLVPNQGDAWKYTLERLELFYERIRSSPPPAPRSVPPAGPIDFLLSEKVGEDEPGLIGGYYEMAALLGRRTAELHLALASRTDEPDFAPESFSAEDRRRFCEGFESMTRGVLDLLGERLPELAPPVRSLAEQVIHRRDNLLGRVRSAMTAGIAAQRIRHHGDYHLGQVLWTGEDFVIIDFEGEPARSLADRRKKGSPLRDVAGMIRSFHYAAHQGLAGVLAAQVAPPGPRQAMERWAEFWYHRVSAAFVAAYRENRRWRRVCSPGRAELEGLMVSFLLEKAVYELGYELNNRPDWVWLPLRGIGRGRGGDDMKQVKRKPVPRGTGTMRYDVSLIGDEDLHFFNEGTHLRMFQKLGSHLTTDPDGIAGVAFAVWAPNAEAVSVIGDFNGWNRESHPLRARGGSGIWEGFIPALSGGSVYKYRVRSRHNEYEVDKADPFAVRQEIPPRTGSLVWDLDYQWGDSAWLQSRRERNALSSPVSIYEVHLGSWMRVPEEGDRFLTYREVAPRLADYVERLGFTHVEFLPLAEHPFYGSWGYQVTGYFAPTSRYGSPQDLMYLVDYLHQRRIGVIFDWVPSHFPTDEHGLIYFDGTHLFEHADPRQGHHRDWDSAIFNYGRHEVRSFLMSSALYWLEAYHGDALRVDAVASMLYLDYSRHAGEWVPNQYGGRENLEAVGFLRRFNRGCLPRAPRRADHRGGIHRLADGVAPPVPGWPGLRAQVGHGMDARHPGLLRAGSGLSSLSPQSPHVPGDVRLHRKLRAPPFPRRSGPRQRFAARENAGRLVAAVRQPPAPARLALLPSPGRSCSSWAVNSARNGNGITIRAWTGICSSSHSTPECNGAWAP